MKSNLIDKAEFTVVGGDGGTGSIHFRREKYVPKGGPDGGNGGRGGSVVLRVNENLATLRHFAGKDRFEAMKGRPGGKRNRAGEDADDLVLEVPKGTVVYVNGVEYQLLEGRKLYGEDVERMVTSGYKTDTVPYFGFGERWSQEIITNNQDTRDNQESITNDQDTSNKQDSIINDQIPDEVKFIEVADLSEAGQELVIARGGRGGLGNDTYKSSRNTTPKVAQRGEKGERFFIRLELKVLADVGLVGLPNVGKSTLLSVLTAARPEIADYPFTTLSPNLGVIVTSDKEQGTRNLVMADIPGLIEDAHLGKGLGVEFLRHVERCRALVYVVAPTEEMMIESDGDPSTATRRTGAWRTQDDTLDSVSLSSVSVAEGLWEQYLTVKKEVQSYGRGLVDKPFAVVVNKTDLMSKEQETMSNDYFAKPGINVLMVSAGTTKGIGELKEKLLRLVNLK